MGLGGWAHVQLGCKNRHRLAATSTPRRLAASLPTNARIVRCDMGLSPGTAMVVRPTGRNCPVQDLLPRDLLPNTTAPGGRALPVVIPTLQLLSGRLCRILWFCRP